MAMMIPDTCPNDPRSEKIVYEALKQYLPDSWTIFHSFMFLSRNKDHCNCEDHEADFVLFNPQYGMLILEVKGGIITYKHNQWYQNNRPINPVFQARHNAHCIMSMLQDALHEEKLPLRVGHALCFPDCMPPENNIWPNEVDGIVITGSELPFLEQFVLRVIKQTPLSGANGKGVSRDAILQIMAPNVQCRPLPSATFECNEQKMYQMFKEQTTTLQMLKGFKRLIFRGCAGSGKTEMAIKKAKMLAAEGKTVLLLCYNEMLAKYLKKSIGKDHYIHTDMFFEYCIRTIKNNDKNFEAKIKDHRTNDNLYKDALPKIMNEAIQREKVDRYDAVIVDEGQDFGCQEWETLSRLAEKSEFFYIFYDPGQNIYEREVKLPDFGIPEIQLNVNYRNTKKIFEAMKPHCSTEYTISDFMPTGVDVRVLTGDCRQNLTAELERLLFEENVCIQDIVILGGHNLEHTSLGSNPQVGKFNVVEGEIKLGAGEITYRTYMKFKGCEANVVILYDVDPTDKRWNNAGLYTAMSRATHQLVVLKKA